MIKWILALLLICLLPVIPITGQKVVWTTTIEEYTILEPYTVTKMVREPYRVLEERVYWQDDGSWDNYKNSIFFSVDESIKAFRSVTPGRWVRQNYWSIGYNDMEEQVTKYREVTKTKETLKPVAKQTTRRTSVLMWIIESRR